MYIVGFYKAYAVVVEGGAGGARAPQLRKCTRGKAPPKLGQYILEIL